MAERIYEFLRFAKDLAEQRVLNAAEEEAVRDPLKDYLDAVAVYVSPRRAPARPSRISRSRPGFDRS